MSEAMQAGARAVGMLQFLAGEGYVPEHHMPQTREILELWDAAMGLVVAAALAEKATA